MWIVWFHYSAIIQPMSRLCVSLTAPVSKLWSPALFGQSVSLAWLKLAALLQQGDFNLATNNKEPTATTIILFLTLTVMCAGLCIMWIRDSVRAQRPPELYGNERSCLAATSFVVALSFEHMAFHVFVQAGYSDPYLCCPLLYTACIILLNTVSTLFEHFS